MSNTIPYSIACHIPLPRSVYGLLKSNLRDCETVLDVGCGEGSILLRLGIKGVKITGLDIWEPYSRNAYARQYEHFIVGDIRDEKIGERTFDIVLMTDVLEHIPKSDVFEYVLWKMELAARKKVIIMVPLGDVGNDSYDGNPYQYHKSVWEAGELEKLGYRANIIWRLRRRHFPSWGSLQITKTAFAVKEM
jgi:cyclopropane fatty-acyl-phospholipid synthase-like methyltransferase